MGGGFYTPEYFFYRFRRVQDVTEECSDEKQTTWHFSPITIRRRVGVEGDGGRWRDDHARRTSHTFDIKDDDVITTEGGELEPEVWEVLFGPDRWN